MTPRTPTRQRRPRPPVVVAAVAISTETVLAIAGIVPRKFRELLAAHPDVPRSRVGHTLIVTAEDFYQLLERVRVTGDDEPEHQEQDDGDQPKSIEDVLCKAGRERVA